MSFAWTQLTPTAGAVVTFTASATGTRPLTCTWDLGDGSPPRAGGPGGGITYTYATAVAAPPPPTWRIYLPLIRRERGP